MDVREGLRILEKEESDYMTTNLERTIRELMDHKHRDSDHQEYHNYIAKIINYLPGYDYMPGQNKLLHILETIYIPPETDDLQLVQVAPENIKFDNIYFSDDGFLGLKLGDIGLMFQLGDEKGIGIFCHKLPGQDWIAKNPRKPIISDELNPETFVGYMDYELGPLGIEFTAYMDKHF